MVWQENPSVDSIDSNVWYAVTESRVNFTSSMQWRGNAISFQNEGDVSNEYWQFFKLDNGNWNIRNQAGDTNKQLGTYYSAAESATSKTRVGLMTAVASDSQEWTIDSSWNDGTYRIQNVGNGTNYNLDVHIGTPLFMSDVLAAEPKQVAQHWMISSKLDINDGAFSTAFAVSTSTSSSPASSSATATSNSSYTATSTSSSTSSATSGAAARATANKQSSHGLSPGASAGVGVGVALAILAAVALFFLFFRRRRANQRGQGPPAELDSETQWKGAETAIGAAVDERKEKAFTGQAVEAPAHDPVYRRSELPSPLAELPGHEVDRKTALTPSHSTLGDEPTKTSSP